MTFGSSADLLDSFDEDDVCAAGPGPSAIPTLSLTFLDAGAGVVTANPAIGSGVATFTRAGATATTHLSSGNISAVIAANTPRSYYDPDTLVYLGYCHEETRQNIILQSEAVDNAAWAAAGQSSISANTAVSPDGNVTADTFNETTTTGSHSFTQAVTKAASAIPYIASYYSKPVTRNWVDLVLDDANGNQAFAYFNTTQPAALGSTSTAGVGMAITTRYVKKATNGFTRLFAGLTSNVQTSIVMRMRNATADLTDQYTGGAGTQASRYFGTQLEQCQPGTNFGTTYIPTTAAAVTRNADRLQYVVAGNIPANDFTLLINWIPLVASMGVVYLWGSFIDANNSTVIFHDGANIVVRKRIAGVNTDAVKALAYNAYQKYTIVARFASTSGIDVFVYGAKGANNANTAACQLGVNFDIGGDGNGTTAGSACFAQVRSYSSALSDAVCSTLA